MMKDSCSCVAALEFKHGTLGSSIFAFLTLLKKINIIYGYLSTNLNS